MSGAVEILRQPRPMQRWAEAARLRGERIALVPTMGYLHEGHLALMREGWRRASTLVVSLFVNPTQFGPNEDFGRYPRDFDRDLRLMEEAAVSVVFAPEVESVYGSGFQSWVEVTKLTRGLCGARRPGHFRGVATVVAKLFNIVKPHCALFGEKDYQQLRAIEQMVEDLNFDVEIVPVPTVREADGLALSSRNACLSPAEREQALALSRALFAARRLAGKGATLEAAINEAQAVLGAASGVRVEYLEAVDARTLEPARNLGAPVLLAVAAGVGKTRLIDNVVLAARPSAPSARA